LLYYLKKSILSVPKINSYLAQIIFSYLKINSCTFFIDFMHIFIHLIIIAIKIALNDAGNFKEICINTDADLY
jgi:hypothetical protein